MSKTVGRLVLDQSALGRPGSDRGLGRYANEVRAAVEAIPLQYVSASRRHIPAFTSVYHAMEPRGLPAVKLGKWVCSFLDTIRADLPGYLRYGVRNKIEWSSACRSDVILPLSDFTAARLRHHLPFSHRLSFVTCSLPVSDIFRRPVDLHSTSLDKKILNVLGRRSYVLMMADFRSPDIRKRLQWMDQVAGALMNSGFGVALVVRGRVPDEFESLERGVMLRNLSDRALAACMSAAAGFVYTSGYEGQGMPPLEALAAGCPVIAFANTAMPEFIRDESFLLEDPHPWQDYSGEWRRLQPSHLRSVVAAIETFTSEEAFWRERARSTVRDLTTERMASRLAVAYRRVGLI